MGGNWLGGVLVVIQIILLVAFYGFGIGTSMPWWVLWLPGLIVVTCIVLAVAFWIIFLILMALIAAFSH